LGLGMSFEGLKEFSQALKWTYRACNLNIRSTLGIYQLTKISYEMNTFDELEEVVVRYLKVEPDDLNIMYTHAGLLYRQERIAESMIVLDAILLKDAENEMALQLRNQIVSENAPIQLRGNKTSNGKKTR
jgi:hypothetical protein